MRQLTWSSEFVRAFHYRTRDGQEVNAVLEHHDGRIIGVEVKASSSISGTDFRHLEHLREKAGERFHSGVALYAGTQILSFGDRLLATPIDSSGKAPWSVEVIREIEPALCDPDHGAPRASVVC